MPNRKLALSFIFLTALIDSIGFGILMPVLPNLYMEITGEGLAQAAIYGGWLLFAYAIMQFFFAPVLGNLSDAYGRKPVLMASMIALCVNYLIMGFAGSLLVLFIGRFVSGIGAATFSTCNAYIADTIPVEERAQYFGLTGAAFGAGFVIGPVLGGFLRDWTNTYDWSILLSFGLSLTAVLCIIFLPTTAHHQLPDWEDALPPEAKTAGGFGSPAPVPPGGGDGSDD